MRGWTHGASSATWRALRCFARRLMRMAATGCSLGRCHQTVTETMYMGATHAQAVQYNAGTGGARRIRMKMGVREKGSDVAPGCYKYAARAGDGESKRLRILDTVVGGGATPFTHPIAVLFCVLFAAHPGRPRTMSAFVSRASSACPKRRNEPVYVQVRAICACDRHLIGRSNSLASALWLSHVSQSHRQTHSLSARLIVSGEYAAWSRMCVPADPDVLPRHTAPPPPSGLAPTNTILPCAHRNLKLCRP